MLVVLLTVAPMKVVKAYRVQSEVFVDTLNI